MVDKVALEQIFLLSALAFASWLLSTHVQYSSIYLTLMFYNLCNWCH
jgi:hypothetical protein